MGGILVANCHDFDPKQHLVVETKTRSRLNCFRLRKKTFGADFRLQIAELRTRILWVAFLLEIVTKVKGGE